MIVGILRLAIFGFALSAAASDLPPAEVERTNYTNWLTAIKSNVSPFVDAGFDWWYEERGRELPTEVYADPDSTFVTVDRGLKETIDLEDVGEIPKAVTYGNEVYSRINADVSIVRDAVLFRWGKPIGKSDGATYPVDAIYGQRRETIQERWGINSYWSMELKARGGLAKDIHDNFTLLVRGNDLAGYDIVGSFHSPFGDTTTTSSLMMIQIRPLAGGFTAYKALTRHLGQYYGFLGVDYGRRNFAFNPTRVRDSQQEFLRSVDELKRTGTIRERPKNR
jgi:hypothetical protein